MMRLLCLILTSALYCVNVEAVSCISDESVTKRLGSKYETEIGFKVSQKNLEIDVSLGFPLTLEGLEFTGVNLIRLKGDSVSFSIPLATRSQGERKEAQYVIESTLSDQNFIEIMYGTPCGVSILYGLDYKNQTLEGKGGVNN